MTEEVVLLKHGFPKVYRVCDCCQRYAGGLSARNWCRYCEWECSAIGKRMRERLALMTPAPIPIEPGGSTGPRIERTARAESG